MKISLYKFSLWALWGAFLSIIFVDPAFAATTVNVDDIAKNIVTGSENLPGLVSGAAYLLGLLLGVLAIFKLKEHVENPTQTPLRVPLIRFIIGGGLLALPIVYEAAARAINGGDYTAFDASTFTVGGMISGILGKLGGLGGLMPDFNGIMDNIIIGIQNVPGLITAMAYLLGLILAFAGLLKIKDHVENPDQTPLRESVIRLLTAGALFALPTVYKAMAAAINGGNGVGLMGTVSSILGTLNWVWSPYTGGGLGGLCNPVSGYVGGTVGDAMCGLILHGGALPAFLSAIAYLIGLILGVWGILKIRDHVLNPAQTQVWEGLSRLIAGGLFFALPVAVEAVRSTMTPASLSAISSPIGNLITLVTNGAGGTITGYNEQAGTACTGLDGALFCMMDDIIGPLHSVLNFFTYSAGVILIMIGISRLIKSAQEGARGPGGIGTIMTFMAGGALLSYNEFMRAFTMSLFSNPTSLTYAKLAYTTGMSQAEMDHAHTVISAILKFMIVIGLISFVRGIFIVRSVAEGNGQASLMAGVTHMVGGALAVNLGPLMNAVQETLGITAYGITFV